MIKLEVTKLGNSTGIILPQELIEKLRINKGDTLYLRETANGFELTTADPEFLQQMEIALDVMQSDQTLLRKLAQ